MTPRSRQITIRKALPACAIGVGVLLRAWRLRWGVYDGYFFPDEVLIFKPLIARFVPLGLDDFVPAVPRLLYPTLYTSLAGVTLGLAHAANLVSLSVPDIVVWARGVSLVAGAFTVLLAIALAWRLYGPEVAAISGLILAVLPQHVLSTWLAGTDVLLSMLFLAVLIAAHSCLTLPTPWRAFFLGLTAGLCYAAKYTGLAVFSVVLWAYGEYCFGKSNRERCKTGRKAGAFLMMLVLGIAWGAFLGCPACWIRADAMLAGWRFHWSVTAHAKFHNAHLTSSLGWCGYPYVYQIVCGFPFWMGLPAYVAAALGVGILARRRRLPDRLLLVAAVPYFLAMGASQVTFPRYMLPVLPLMAVTAAVFLYEKLEGSVRILCVTAVVAYTAGLTATLARAFDGGQPAEVREFLVSQLGPGRTVALPAFGPYYGISPGSLSRFGLKTVEVGRTSLPPESPDVLVVPEFWLISMQRDWPETEVSKFLQSLERGHAEGYRLAATWPSNSFLNRSLYRWLDPGHGAVFWQGFRVYFRDREAGHR